MFYEGRRVLVTGGTGTIGIPLVRRLVAQGAKVTVVALDARERAVALFGDSIEYRQADLTDFTACLAITRDQEFVFNLVGIKGSVGIGVSRAASYYVPMLWFNTNMMEAAFRSGVARYLFVSSICAYPPAELHHEDNLWSGLPRQNDRFAGIAKRAGEIQGETYLHEFGWDAVRIVRPSNVYGPYDDFDPATAQVIPALIRRMLDGENPVTVWGDGSALRDFIYSADVAAGMLAALEKLPPCVPVNLGSGRGRTIREVADAIAGYVRPAPEIRWDPSKPTGDQARVLEVSRARELIQFEASTTLEDGIRQTIEWYERHRETAAGRVGGLRPAGASR